MTIGSPCEIFCLPMHRHDLAPLLLLALAVFSPASAGAQTDDDLAREHFRAGRAYFERAQYEDAAREFEEAHALSGRATLLLNLSRSYELNGQTEEAIDALERWQASEDVEADDEARALAASRLERLRQQQALEDEEREAAATAQQEAEEAARLAAEDPPMSRMRIAGIGTLSAGGAAMIVAVISGSLARVQYNELDDVCPDGVCPPEYADEKQRGKRLALTADIFGAVSLAAIVTGAVLMVIDDVGGDEAGGPELDVAVDRHGVRGGLRFAF